MSDLDDHYARRVLAACDALTDEERAALVPAVRDILFQGEKPRVAMSFEACQALLEGLVPRKSANASSG